MRARYLAAILATLVVAGAACGSRRDLGAYPYEATAQSAAAPAADTGAASAPAALDAGAAGHTAAGDTGGPAAAAATAQAGQQPAARSGAAASPASGPAALARSATPGRAAPAGSSATAATRSAASSATPAPAPGAPATAAGCAPKCAPVMVGHVGTYSGVFASFANAPEGVRAWGQAVNARGGIDGHPVKVIVAEDGGDPARHRSLVQSLVEQDGVIAFIHGFNPTTGHAAVDYLTKKGVPVVGSDPSSNWYYDSPVYFPHGSAGGKGLTKALLGATAEAALPRGKTKMAILACNEAQVCRDVTVGMPAAAGQFGLKVVSQAQASLAQPDYTAECLAARNAGAEIFFLAFDSQSYGRVAKSCNSVGYKPMFSLVPNVTNNIAEIKEMDGAVITAVVKPWFDTTHPGIAAMHAAMKQYTPRAQPDKEASLGWTSAVLFERAATGHLSATPTSQDILNGLWSLHDETLGGLTYPLTFRKGQNAEVKSCWWVALIQNARFTTPTPNVKCA
jgi:branched-chain amino acid transport system substrate-binding protein